MSDRLRAVLARFGDDVVEAYETGNAEGYAKAKAEDAAELEIAWADEPERDEQLRAEAYARAIADVCAWLREDPHYGRSDAFADAIGKRFRK